MKEHKALGIPFKVTPVLIPALQSQLKEANSIQFLECTVVAVIT
jgi:hypothetical protein